MALDEMSAKGGKAGNAILLGFEIGKMRIISELDSDHCCEQRLQRLSGVFTTQDPPATCELRLCCLDGSVGNLQHHERANQLPSLDNGRAYTVTSSVVLWLERDVLAVSDRHLKIHYQVPFSAQGMLQATALLCIRSLISQQAQQRPESYP